MSCRRGSNAGLVADLKFMHVARCMKKSALVVFLFVAVCASMFVNLVLLALLGASGKNAMAVINKSQSEYDEEMVVSVSGSHDKIAVIPLRGVIGYGMDGSLGESMVEDFKLALQQAAEDDRVKGVIVEVDSPGGEITASDVLYNALLNFKKEKPVVVFFNAIGASGAYYMACGADWIMCNDTTFTGSIGVIISTLNYRELFGKIGLEAVIFKSGKFKDMLNGAREISPEEKEYIQGLVMQSYDRFLGIVAKSRKLDAGKLRDGAANGRILSGTDAFSAKLVDQLGYIEDAYEKARELSSSPKASIVRYVRRYHFANLLRLFGESASTTVQIDITGKKPALEPGRIYLLPPFFAP
jgi:protease-4